MIGSWGGRRDLSEAGPVELRSESDEAFAQKGAGAGSPRPQEQQSQHCVENKDLKEASVIRWKSEEGEQSRVRQREGEARSQELCRF